jgi:hypothetical protein
MYYSQEITNSPGAEDDDAMDEFLMAESRRRAGVHGGVVVRSINI